MTAAQNNGETLNDTKLKIDLGNGDKSLEDITRQYLALVLNKVNWNKTKACEVLKISKPTLDKKIRDFNLHPSPKV